MQSMLGQIRKHKIISIVIFAMLLLGTLRVTLHADVYDEIFNLSVSYRVAMGDLPYYQCWEAYQGGDLFLSPFLWLYVNIVGTSSGIVLYSRFIYLLWLAACSFIVFRAINFILPKLQAFVIALSCYFFSIYGLFYLWYDTVSVLLLLAGCFSIFIAIVKGNKSGWAILGSFLHGLMVLAYPSLILITVLCFIFELVSCIKNKNKLLLIYFIIGYLCALVVGFVIILYIGIENFIFGIKVILSYRNIASGSSSSFIIFDILHAYYAVNKPLIIFTVPYVLVGILVYKKKKYLHGYLLAGLILPIVICLKLDDGYRGLLNYAAYIGLWAPILYLLTTRLCENASSECEVSRNSLIKKSFLYVWLPSVLSVIPIAISTVYADEGPIKAWEGMFSSALISIVVLTVLWQSFPHRNLKIWNDVFSNAVGLVFSCCLLINSYSYIYLNAPYITMNDPISKHGVYAGIKVKKEMLEWESVKQWLQPYIQGKKTILVSFIFNPIYLMTDLKPLTPSVESPTYYLEGEVQWEMALKYFKTFNEYPDVMILSKTDMEDDEIQQLLNEKYYLAGSKTFSWGTATVFLLK